MYISYSVRGLKFVWFGLAFNPPEVKWKSFLW